MIAQVEVGVAAWAGVHVDVHQLGGSPVDPWATTGSPVSSAPRAAPPPTAAPPRRCDHPAAARSPSRLCRCSTTPASLVTIAEAVTWTGPACSSNGSGRAAIESVELVRKADDRLAFAGVDRGARRHRGSHGVASRAWWILESFKSVLQDGALPADNSCVGNGNSGY